jgi:hypothetical protein
MGSENINPWIHIWVRPKKTMRFILDRDSKRVIIRLAIIGGVVSSFTWLEYIWSIYPDRQDLKQNLYTVLILIGGGFSGLIYLYVAGWLYKLTGSWLGGKGTYTDVKCAVGWSNYPFILANVASFLSLLAIPNPWLQAIFGLIDVVIVVWSVMIFLNLVGGAHRFSAWRALLAFIIGLVLVFATIMIASLFIPLLAPLFY